MAVFGEKDLQQLRIIERLVSDLYIPTQVLPAPTAREADGLAMSSRNRYLTVAQRRQAPVLYRALDRIREALLGGERDYRSLERQAVEELEEAGLRPDYVSVRRGDDLQLPDVNASRLAILGAAWLGRARLIDNLQVQLDAA